MHTPEYCSGIDCPDASGARGAVLQPARFVQPAGNLGHFRSVGPHQRSRRNRCVGVTSQFARRRFAVVGIAVGGHALVLWLLLRMGATPSAGVREVVSVWLSVSPAPRVDEQPSPPPGKAAIVRRPVVAPVVAPQLAAESPAGEPAGEQAPAAVDWFGEAAKSAGRIAARGQDKAADFFTPAPVRRKHCVRPPSATQWKPEEKKYGFAGGLPYVRLGKCVVGLGFFGCVPGAPPAANSHLLDGRDRATEDDSSVPDANGCELTPDTGEIRKEEH